MNIYIFLIILHNLGGNSPVDTTDTLWVKHFVKTALSHIISEINALYAEIQDGLQQMVGKRFPAVSAVTLQVKNFVKITLPRTISKINAFCILHRNSRWPPKCGKKVFLGKLASRPCRHPAGQNFCRSENLTISEILKMFHFQC